MSERMRFESWAKDRVLNLQRAQEDTDRYHSPNVQLAWEAWQERCWLDVQRQNRQPDWRGYVAEQRSVEPEAPGHA